MSRSGYADDFETAEEQWALIRWRGAVNAAIRGKRGQAFLRELGEAMDAMPVKELIADELATASGEHCAIGVVGAARGTDMRDLDPEDAPSVAMAFGIAPALAKEVVFMNDEAAWWAETPAQRWQRMRNWVSENLTNAA
ncbi:MAG: hypothetical protein RJQ08_11630 [Salinisphaeraceae bacterium]